MTDGNAQRPVNQGQANTSPLGEAVQRDCVACTDQYRNGELTKVTAILRIQHILAGDGLDDASIEQALGPYLDMLDNYGELRRRSAELGREHGVPQDEEQDDEPEHGLEAPLGGASKRPRQADPDDEEDGSPGKRRIDTKVFPWAIQDELNPATLDPSLEKTRLALENFSRDIKLAKASLLNSARCPELPDSEWTSILSGRALNLDHIFAALFTASYDDRRTEKLGTVEVIIGGPQLTKTITTHGNWIIAWDQAVEATVYVFPHRAGELKAHGRYITQLFSGMPEQAHDRVIALDKAMRIRVASRRDLLLTNQQAFADLFSIWITNAAAAITAGERKSKLSRPPVNKRDPCQRYNANRCPNSFANCRYAHVCSNCRSNGHRSSECQATKN